MKKPLILLVDDDTSVLEALEAALAPCFEGICRVEAFEDPRAVLDAVPAWEAEERSIAVAIVDQKMPGLTGVELVDQLRSTNPARNMRAILLTGYAGLESALAAKNTALVERYLEKPWEPSDLAGQVKEALSGYLRDSGDGAFVVFREIDNEADLKRHLSLRYQIYRITPGIKHVLPTDGSGLDMDNYDPISHLFGLYRCDTEGSRMIGTIRAVGSNEGPQAGQLAKLAEGFPSLRARLEEPRREPLPLMTYLVDRDAVERVYSDLVERNEVVVEPGRLTLELKSRRETNLKALARHLIESAASLFYVFVDHAILTCSPRHMRFYEPLGFRETEGTRAQLQPALGGNYACLHGTRSGVPSGVQPRLVAFSERIRRKGGTCFCPTFPACIPDAYATADFGSNDLFCPWEAQATLAGDSPE